MLRFCALGNGMSAAPGGMITVVPAGAASFGERDVGPALRLGVRLR